MFNQMNSFLSMHNVLYDYQFGFRPKHSTYMPLSLLHDLITANLVEGRFSAGIYLDLARAFDTVNTEILLKKLSKYGITGSALKLLTSYLTHRIHRLKYEGIISGPETITCGVPQGSVLGPLLFLLYINDMQFACNEAKFLLFADDTAIFYSASSLADLQDSIITSFPKVVAWLHANRLSLSTPKTFYQIYAPGGTTDTLYIPVGTAQLSRAHTVKYLGVLVDDDLKFKSHVEKVSGVTSRNLGIINRAKYLLQKKHKEMLYNALILPYLSYCIPIWGSNYEQTLKPLVTIQKRAIRLISGVGPLEHTSPLFSNLKLLKLSDLNKYNILLIMHDAMFRRIPDVVADKFKLHTATRPTRSQKHFSTAVESILGGSTPNYRLTNYRSFCIFCRGPSVWNDLVARHIPNIRDIPASKTLFKSCLKNIFIDEYT